MPYNNTTCPLLTLSYKLCKLSLRIYYTVYTRKNVSEEENLTAII